RLRPARLPLFHDLNANICVLLGLSAWDREQLQVAVYGSPAGWAVMRCIAFAYTYHYLNWFAKTSIIKWHAVSRRRLAVIAGLCLGSVGVYGYDYRVGFIALYTLSFLHVLLEFPLNHRTVIGIAAELRARWRPAAAGRPRHVPRTTSGTRGRLKGATPRATK